MPGLRSVFESWLRDATPEWVKNALLRVLAAGPIPRHVAFVMDGNRRYARALHKRVEQGHAEGLVALRRVLPTISLKCCEGIELTGPDFEHSQVLDICMRLNITCVSAYAFSIDNFKRTPDEVDALMTLAKTKMIELCEHG